MEKEEQNKAKGQQPGTEELNVTDTKGRIMGEDVETGLISLEELRKLVTGLHVEKVEYCNEKFPTYGGMKWGTEEAMVKRLAEQAQFEGKPPRDYSRYKYLPATQKMMDTIHRCIANGWELARQNGVNSVMPNA